MSSGPGQIETVGPENLPPSKSSGKARPARAGASKKSKEQAAASGEKSAGSVENEAVETAVEKLNKAVRENEKYPSRKINFNIFPEQNIVQARVVNNQNDEIIRSIPPDEMIEIKKRIDAFLGLMFDISG